MWPLISDSSFGSRVTYPRAFYPRDKEMFPSVISQGRSHGESNPGLRVDSSASLPLDDVTLNVSDDVPVKMSPAGIEPAFPQ